MPALREVYAEYTVDFDRRRDLQRGDQAVTRTRGSLRRLIPTVTRAAAALTGLAALAGGAAAVGLGRIVQGTTESIRELERWSGRIGISRDALQSWIGLGAEYGADVDAVTDALKEMQLKATDALAGGTSQAEMFQRIGISLDDLRPVINDTDQLMQLFVRRLGAVESQALRNFTVDEIMSDAGTRMNQVFALGNTEIARRRAAISGVLGPTEELSRAVAEHTRSVISVTRRWTAFKRELTLRVLPVIDQIGEKLGELAGPIRTMIMDTNLLEGALVALGVVGVGVAVATVAAWGPMALAVIAVAAAAAGVAVAYDQITRTIGGSTTALRTYLDEDERLGEGGTEGVLLLLSDGWDNLTRRIGIATTALSDFYELIQPVVEFVQSVWAPLTYIQGGFLGDIYESGMGALRGAAQERVGEERIQQGRDQRGRNRRIATEENRLAERGGVYRDIYGERVSRQAPLGESRLGAQPTSLPRREREPWATTIDAPMSVDISIAEATDADGVARVVRREIEVAQSRQISELEAMSQPSESAS